MHESRIAGLEKRLTTLHKKLGDPRWTPAQIDAEIAAAETELRHLVGIRDRNTALAAEAPQMAAAAAVVEEGRRRRREAAQFTPGGQAAAKAAAQQTRPRKKPKKAKGD